MHLTCPIRKFIKLYSVIYMSSSLHNRLLHNGWKLLKKIMHNPNCSSSSLSSNAVWKKIEYGHKHLICYCWILGRLQKYLLLEIMKIVTHERQCGKRGSGSGEITLTEEREYLFFLFPAFSRPSISVLPLHSNCVINIHHCIALNLQIKWIGQQRPKTRPKYHFALLISVTVLK